MRLSRTADDIQHLLEDGVDITNLLKPLESGLRLIRDILSENRADPVQSLGNNLSFIYSCLLCLIIGQCFCNGI